MRYIYPMAMVRRLFIVEIENSPLPVDQCRFTGQTPPLLQRRESIDSYVLNDLDEMDLSTSPTMSKLSVSNFSLMQMFFSQAVLRVRISLHHKNNRYRIANIGFLWTISRAVRKTFLIVATIVHWDSAMLTRLNIGSTCR